LPHFSEIAAPSFGIDETEFRLPRASESAAGFLRRSVCHRVRARLLFDSKQ
jgi:hypothetical protein